MRNPRFKRSLREALTVGSLTSEAKAIPRLLKQFPDLKHLKD